MDPSMTITDAFLPRSATRVVVYLQPINVRWGTKKLGALCREVMRVEPDTSTCFVFVNGSRDTMLSGPRRRPNTREEVGQGFVLASRSRERRCAVRCSTCIDVGPTIPHVMKGARGWPSIPCGHGRATGCGGGRFYSGGPCSRREPQIATTTTASSSRSHT